MASFCTKCGSALADGTQFCTSCGASAGGPSPSAPSAASGAGAPSAAPAPPAAAAPPQGSGAVKIVLIVLGIFVGIGLLTGAAVMFGLYRISRNVNVNRSGQVTINTPGGKVSMGPGSAAVSEAELGVPLYPNAKREEGSFQLSTAEGSMATYIFKTADSPAQVMAFYRGKLSPKTTFLETPDGGVITSANDEKVGFMINVSREQDGPTSIAIFRSAAKTAQ